jgi:hypothetical protein
MELVAQYEREYLVSKQWLLWDLRDVANLDDKREQTARGQSTTVFHGYSVPNSDTHYIPNGYTYSIPNAHSYSLPHPDPHPPRLIESKGGQEQAPTVSLSGWESHTTVIRNPDPVLQMHREVAGNLAPMLTDTRGGLARADWINL